LTRWAAGTAGWATGGGTGAGAAKLAASAGPVVLEETIEPEKPEELEAELELAGEARARVPGIELATDLVVGFPGETEEEFADFETKKAGKDELLNYLKRERITPSPPLLDHLESVGVTPFSGSVTLYDFLKKPGACFELLFDLPIDLPGLRSRLAGEWAETLLYDVKYEGYKRRDAEIIAATKKFEEQTIPVDFRFFGLGGLSSEAVEKLSRVKPGNLAQASRIPGITPAAISILSVHLRKSRSSDVSI